MLDLTGEQYLDARTRQHPARLHTCALCPALAYGWDHCHEHGLIRGPLCRDCNWGMSFIDAGILLGSGSRLIGWGNRVQGTPPPNHANSVGMTYRAQCPACSAGLPPITAAGQERASWELTHRIERMARRIERLRGKSGVRGKLPDCLGPCPAVQFLCGVPLHASGIAYLPFDQEEP